MNGLASPRATVVLAALAGALALAAGCAGELDRPERFADCPPGYVEQVFQRSCAGDCHAGAEPEAGLDLVSPGAGARLLGAASVQEECAGLVMIDPAGGPHLLLQKLDDQPPCGSRMPFGEPELDPADVECVRRWIDEVAGGGP